MGQVVPVDDLESVKKFMSENLEPAERVHMVGLVGRVDEGHTVVRRAVSMILSAIFLSIMCSLVVVEIGTKNWFVHPVSPKQTDERHSADAKSERDKKQ